MLFCHHIPRLYLLASCLHSPTSLKEILYRLASQRIRLLISFDITQQPSACFAALPGFGKLIWRLRNSAFKALPYDAFGWACYGGEEIRCGLAFRALKSHIGEELLCLTGTAEVYLTALVENGHLIKNLYNGPFISTSLASYEICRSE